MTGRSTKIYVVVFYEKFGIYVTQDLLIRFDDSFHFHVDEEIVRVDVLFDKTFHLEEGW